MKTNFKRFVGFGKRLSVVSFIMCITNPSISQITPSLGDPSKYIYALTDRGEIYEIDAVNATLNRVIKDSSYNGNPSYFPNALGYSPSNGKFYYFKRNFLGASIELVSLDATTNTLRQLAIDTAITITVTGCVTNDGKGYYTIDRSGSLYYYSIDANTWTQITGSIIDGSGDDISSRVRGLYGSGDLAIDGKGNIWMVISGIYNYGVYMIPGPLPTTPVSKITATKIVDPATATPAYLQQFGGIAFNPAGQIFLSCTDGNLYLLQNTTVTRLIAPFGIGNRTVTDLTSLNFPVSSKLPVTWISFDVTVQDNTNVVMNWVVEEQDNKGYYIEESQDGRAWNDLHFIPAKNRPGIEQHYSWSYANTIDGTTYYRIKQVDMDGDENYSEIKKVICSHEFNEIVIWPNPAQKDIHINKRGDGDGDVAVFDLTGKQVLARKIQQGVSVIDISSLLAGIYLVKATTQNKSFYSQAIIKQ